MLLPCSSTVYMILEMSRKVHEGKALKDFIKDRTNIRAFVRETESKRPRLDYLFNKQYLTTGEKNEMYELVVSVWGDVDRREVFAFEKGKTNTIIGDGNIQDSHTTGTPPGTIAPGREAELLAEIATLKDRIIELLTQLNEK